MDANNSDLEHLANRAAGYIIATMRLFRNHDPEEFIESERENIEKTVVRLQRFVGHKPFFRSLNDAISLSSTMGKIIEYARSKSETPPTTLSRIGRKASQVVHASDDRQRIDKLTKELDHTLSLLSVSTYYINTI